MCPTLGNPTNGVVDLSGTSVGDTATYTCDSGYELVGTPVLNCLANGAWDNSPPVCRCELVVFWIVFVLELFYILLTAHCPDLDHPVNGTVSQSGNSEGDTALYTCNSGYELVGASVLNCQDDGTWDNSPPFCHSVGGKTENLNSINMTCPNYHTLITL